MPARLLIICLDGADPGLLWRWAADGSLPSIAALQSRGRTGDLATPPGLGDDAAWASFYTGEPVGAHGRYYWRQLEPDGPRLEISGGRWPANPPFWSQLAPTQPVAIIDLPKAVLWRKTRGIQLCDWLVHGRDHPKPLSHPADLAGRVIAEFGAPPTSFCDYTVPHLEDDEIAQVTDRLARAATMKRDAICRFLGDDDWALMIAGFKEAHCATHLFWYLHEPAHPDYRPDADRRLHEPVKTVYRAIDRAVGDIVAKAGPGTSILLFTPLAMAWNVTGNHLMEPLAKAINRRHRARLGSFARIVAGVAASVSARFAGNGGRQPFALCRALPHNEISGALRLHVTGRDTGGMVAAGPPYRALCRQLAEEIGDLRDGETGQRIVADVLISQDAFPGPQLDRLPDLFVVWERNAAIIHAVSPHFGLIAAQPVARKRSGNHIPGGRYIVAGPAGERWQAGNIDISQLGRLFLEAGGALNSPLPHACWGRGSR